MKLIYKEFYCSVCRQVRVLKVEDICLDCHDNQILNEILQGKSDQLN